MRQVCKCHGVSGSCSIKVCWKVMPEFSVIGKELMRRYVAAHRVESSEAALRSLRHKNLKDELVFSEASPDFCGSSHGTVGRVCSSRNQTAANNASSALTTLTLVADRAGERLCCGRGWEERRVEIIEECECEFKWCCEVKCKQCKRIVLERVCQ